MKKAENHFSAFDDLMKTNEGPIKTRDDPMKMDDDGMKIDEKATE